MNEQPTNHGMKQGEGSEVYHLRTERVMRCVLGRMRAMMERMQKARVWEHWEGREEVVKVLTDGEAYMVELKQVGEVEEGRERMFRAMGNVVGELVGAMAGLREAVKLEGLSREELAIQHVVMDGASLVRIFRSVDEVGERVKELMGVSEGKHGGGHPVTREHRELVERSLRALCVLRQLEQDVRLHGGAWGMGWMNRVRAELRKAIEGLEGGFVVWAPSYAGPGKAVPGNPVTGQAAQADVPTMEQMGEKLREAEAAGIQEQVLGARGLAKIANEAMSPQLTDEECRVELGVALSRLAECRHEKVLLRSELDRLLGQHTSDGRPTEVVKIVVALWEVIQKLWPQLLKSADSAVLDEADSWSVVAVRWLQNQPGYPWGNESLKVLELDAGAVEKPGKPVVDSQAREDQLRADLKKHMESATARRQKLANAGLAALKALMGLQFATERNQPTETLVKALWLADSAILAMTTALHEGGSVAFLHLMKEKAKQEIERMVSQRCGDMYATVSRENLEEIARKKETDLIFVKGKLVELEKELREAKKYAGELKRELAKLKEGGEEQTIMGVKVLNKRDEVIAHNFIPSGPLSEFAQNVLKVLADVGRSPQLEREIPLRLKRILTEVEFQLPGAVLMYRQRMYRKGVPDEWQAVPKGMLLERNWAQYEYQVQVMSVVGQPVAGEVEAKTEAKEAASKPEAGKNRVALVQCKFTGTISFFPEAEWLSMESRPDNHLKFKGWLLQ